jgi:GT2 family glycosyltransferase
VEASRGRILLFTDDDVLVEPSWVDQMVAPFDDPAVGAVGGRVLPQWPAPPPAWLHGPHADLITMVDRGEEPRMYDRDKVPSGASMAIRVTALGGVARPFDPRLGRTGSDSMAGEEDAVLFGLHDSGWALSYTPKALAWHRITPERMTWPALARQHFGSGVARARVDRMRPDAELDGVPIRGARFARAIGRAVARNARRPAPVDPTDAGVRLDAYRRLGYAAESLLGTAPRFARWVERRLQPFQRGT